MTKKAKKLTKAKRTQFLVEHVRGEGWRVLKNGRVATGWGQHLDGYKTRFAAFHDATCLARANALAELRLKKRDGRFSQWGERTYGADPFPPRG